MTNFVVRDPALKIISTSSAKTTLGILNTDSSFTTLTYGTTTTWNTNNSYKPKAIVTLTGNSLLSITNSVNGAEGILIVKQDATGNRLIYLPSNSYGNINLNTVANGVTIFKYYYDGTNYYWDSTIADNYKALNITANSIATNLKWVIYPNYNKLDNYGNTYNFIYYGENSSSTGLKSVTKTSVGIYYTNPLLNQSSANFTIAIRAKMTFKGSSSGILVIPYFNDGTWSTPFASWYLNGNLSTNKFEINFTNTSGTLNGAYAFSSYTYDGSYKLVTITKSGSSAILYINGVSQQTLTVSNTSWNIPSTAGDICIGSREKVNPTENCDIQQLDFAAIWFRALSGTEVSNLNSNVYSLLQ